VWYIWQMCEILFFPDDPAPPVATSLADWLESQGSGKQKLQSGKYTIT
jgi:hypothetical protein